MANAAFIYRMIPDSGEPFIVGVSTRDILAWEKEVPGRSAGDLQGTIALSNAYWLAHRAAKRVGLFEGTRKELEETHDLEGATEKELREFRGEDPGDGDGSDPTRPAR